jgi:hypothetical protein
MALNVDGGWKWKSAAQAAKILLLLVVWSNFGISSEKEQCTSAHASNTGW